jgi:hypothetical protein
MSATSQLWEELEASGRLAVTERGQAFLRRVGWPPEAAPAGLGGGLVRASFSQGVYEPTEDGPGCIVIPVFNIATPDRTDQSHLIDLVAWNPRSGEIGSRLGNVDFVGEYAVTRALFGVGERRIEVFPDPLSWATSGLRMQPVDAGHGVVVLRWSSIWQRLGSLQKVACHSQELARKVQQYLRPPVQKIPAITVILSSESVENAA